MPQENSRNLILGLSLPQEEVDACNLLKLSRQDGFDYVTTMLPKSMNESRSDVILLDDRWWSTSIVGQVEEITNGLNLQLEWAWHMNLPVVILTPNYVKESLEEYARIVYSLALTAQQFAGYLWIPVTLQPESLQQWQKFYALCHYHENIAILLKCESSVQYPLAAQLQWLHIALGQPVRAVQLDCHSFLTNKHGFPVLSKTTQTLFSEILCRIGRTVRVLLKGPSSHNRIEDDRRGTTGCIPYVQYLQHFRVSRAEISAVLDRDEATLEEPYLDVLQMPLQPLKDHLKFKTYEVFEKDPIKYQRYQVAVAMALTDRRDLHKCVVLVVGAGRGPLVSCVLRAYKDCMEKPAEISVFAIEKNPSAIVYLNSKAQHDQLWREFRVKIIHADLRSISVGDIGGSQAHIVVSELLGSFGCNELSPECLDSLFLTNACGANTISIPCNYTSHIAPVSSTKLHAQVRGQALFPNEYRNGVLGMQQVTETPYVVRTHAASQMMPEQDCWVFRHPALNMIKSRHASLTFFPDISGGCGNGSGYTLFNADLSKLAEDSDQQGNLPWTLTGLLGTFTAVLYRNDAMKNACLISTAPKTFSTGMFSWFPLYFPLHEPIEVPAGASVKVNIWRRIDDSESKVWYEWQVIIHRDGETLVSSPIHNPMGRSYHVAC